MSAPATREQLMKMASNRDMAMKYVTDSKVILSSPGRLISDLYYTKANSTVDQVEAEYTCGRFKQSLSSKSFSSSGNVNIPNQSFAGLMLLELVLPDLAANTSLPRGWGYHCIDRIDYVWGSVNIGNLSMDGHSLFQTVITQCLTSEKKSQILKLGGEEKLSSDGEEASAVVVIPLPWSSIQGGECQKRPYDTSILGNPIQVNIYFRAAEAVYGGSGTKPSEFVRATALLRQAQLSYPGMGLKSMMKSMGGGFYIYPMLRRQTASFQVTSSSFEIGVNLTQFITADLLSIYIGITEAADEDRTTDNTPNRFNYVDLTDTRLIFNGQVLMDCPGRSHLVFQSGQVNGSTYYENSYVLNGTTAPFTSVPVNNNLFIYDSTRLRDENFCNHFQNARRYGQQVMNFYAGVPKDATLYNVHCTYIYNGMSLTGLDGNNTVYFT